MFSADQTIVDMKNITILSGAIQLSKMQYSIMWLRTSSSACNQLHQHSNYFPRSLILSIKSLVTSKVLFSLPLTTICRFIKNKTFSSTPDCFHPEFCSSASSSAVFDLGVVVEECWRMITPLLVSHSLVGLCWTEITRSFMANTDDFHPALFLLRQFVLSETETCWQYSTEAARKARRCLPYLKVSLRLR